MYEQISHLSFSYGLQLDFANMKEVCKSKLKCRNKIIKSIVNLLTGTSALCLEAREQEDDSLQKLHSYLGYSASHTRRHTNTSTAGRTE
jgi:hypothetical protein